MAVADGRIVSVGTLESLRPLIDQRTARIDRTLENKVLVPGLIDPHVHPSLPAVLTQFPFIAPDDWSLPTGVFPGAKTPEGYVARLRELVAGHGEPDIPFITWGYHQLWHGDLDREALTALFLDVPVMLWHRSFHEMILNDAALEWVDLSEADVEGNEEIDWARGHFWENGFMSLVGKLSPLMFAPERYGQGMKNFLDMVHAAGVTTCLDMGIGIFGDPVGETDLIRETAESSGAPTRIILTPIITDFLARGVSIPDALKEVDLWREGNTRRVIFDRRFKIMMDGAIYSGLCQIAYPGYMDGHEGMWLAPVETTKAWTEASGRRALEGGLPDPRPHER